MGVDNGIYLRPSRRTIRYLLYYGMRRNYAIYSDNAMRDCHNVPHGCVILKHNIPDCARRGSSMRWAIAIRNVSAFYTFRNMRDLAVGCDLRLQAITFYLC